MRIVLDATPLLGRRTGIGAYTAQLLRALPAALGRAQVMADLCVTTWTMRGGRPSDLPAGVRQVGAPVPARLLREAWARTDHPRIEALVGRCDVMHGTNFVSPPTRHAREVVTLHDLTYELHPDTVSAQSLAYRRLVPRALARGAHVLAVSEAAAGRLREFYGLTPDRVTVTPLGVDEPWFAALPPDPSLRRHLDLPPEYLVFVGSLDPRKNLPRLVEAHASLSARSPGTPPLVLAGPAGRDERLTAMPGVRRTGWLEPAQLRSVVAGARALVLPSLDEGFGLPVLEALACGRPVLVGDVPALREVGGPFVVPADPVDVDALGLGLAAVLEWADDDEARAARRAYARGWTWSRTADLTVAAYLRQA